MTLCTITTSNCVTYVMSLVYLLWNPHSSRRERVSLAITESLLTLLFRAVTHIHTQKRTKKKHQKISKPLQNNCVSLMLFPKGVGILIRDPNSHKRNSAYRGRPLQESLHQAAGQPLLNEDAIWYSITSKTSTSQSPLTLQTLGYHKKRCVNTDIVFCGMIPIEPPPCPFPSPLLHHHLFPLSSSPKI